MSRIHVFNPDHDIALAFGSERFTSPAAGRGLRNDLAFLPAFWAEDDDVVVVDDQTIAQNAVRAWGRCFPDVRFAALREMNILVGHGSSATWVVDPWGWNAAIRFQLLRAGVPEAVLPSPAQIASIRNLSHRQTAIPLLQGIVGTVEGTIGERFVAYEMGEVQEKVMQLSSAVVKAPWSSSGRGVRFVGPVLTGSAGGFVKNVIERQGCVIVEPHYERLLDFGMEFYSDGEGKASYAGLSLFETRNGAYLGNTLADEEEKRQRLSSYLPCAWLDEVREALLPRLGDMCKNVYDGPLGVDMMVVSTPDGIRLHPCVEVNVRRTMGHVALCVFARTSHRGMMRVVMESGRYELRIE